MTVLAKAVISDDYRKVQRHLHETNPNYGIASVQYAPIFSQLLRRCGAKEVLDYGAGKGRLAEVLKKILPVLPTMQHYDPAVPEWAGDPKPSPVVACIDVLEHVEPDLLDHVLDHLQQLTLQFGFFTIHTGPAQKILPDGRNAHLVQQPAEWWMPKIMSRFELSLFNKMPQGFWLWLEKRK
ncbi:MAG TPA: methyltransferase domain-containing protein [Dongiaceae bacterium]|nr:methyltransferase domain-containing protein [Dongiaceae bacterium]